MILSSGGYGGATITKSVSVNAPAGVVAFVGRTITVTIASTDTVTLRGLSMNGASFGDADGIAFTAGGTLNIENTVISSFATNGVNDVATSSNLWVNNCDVEKNVSVGIYVLGASAVIENSRAVENYYGVFADNSSTVAIRSSVAGGNSSVGFYAVSTAGVTELVVDSCMATNNAYGLGSYQSGTGSVATLRAGQNIVMNNATANLYTLGGNLISQGGNRIGGATGGSTGFTGTVAQQ